MAQSYFAFSARDGGAVMSEEDPIDLKPAREMRESVAAVRHLEETVLAASWTEGIVERRIQPVAATPAFMKALIVMR